MVEEEAKGGSSSNRRGMGEEADTQFGSVPDHFVQHFVHSIVFFVIWSIFNMLVNKYICR